MSSEGSLDGRTDRHWLDVVLGVLLEIVIDPALGASLYALGVDGCIEVTWFGTAVGLMPGKTPRPALGAKLGEPLVELSRP